MCESKSTGGGGGGAAGWAGELEGSGGRVCGAACSRNLIGPRRLHATFGNRSAAGGEENGVHCLWGLAAVAPLGAAVAEDRGPR